MGVSQVEGGEKHEYEWGEYVDGCMQTVVDSGRSECVFVRDSGVSVYVSEWVDEVEDVTCTILYELKRLIDRGESRV